MIYNVSGRCDPTIPKSQKVSTFCDKLKWKDIDEKKLDEVNKEAFKKFDFKRK